jgi:ADP-heptose:LPS heptosyltransferase
MAHVAGAVGVPTVVVFGPTDPQRWKPAGAHVCAVVAASGRVADVDPGEVLEVAQTLLASRDAAPRASISPP